ncbi:hypothetical protein [Desulfovibrio porci]|uniref:DprA-like winged helix domain-containing protein n=1 Tax=Desulfovibrio porci TaxID=2605782 RepID=UPI003A951DE0
MAGNCDQICKEYIIISGRNSYQVYFSLGLNLVTTLSKENSAVLPLPAERACAEAESLAPADRRERLLHCLRAQGPMQADALASALDMPVYELNALLIGLEMLAQVRRLPGARYEVPA